MPGKRTYYDVKRTYELSPEDAARLVSYALRYRFMETMLDEDASPPTMTVLTSFVGTEEATSTEAHFDMEVVSDDPPPMPEDERIRRIEGRTPGEER